MLNTYSFRTEFRSDSARVEKLLIRMGMDWAESAMDELGPKLIKVSTFVIQTELALEELRQLMTYFINNDDRYANLHRCYQTLKPGNEPDANWHGS